jgi:hypothetical protein
MPIVTAARKPFPFADPLSKRKSRGRTRGHQMTDDNHSQRDEENPEYVMTVTVAVLRRKYLFLQYFAEN